MGGACLLLAVLGPVARGQGPDTTVRDLADVTQKPSLISHPDLGYKDCFKEAGLRGTDLVKFVIDTAGHVEQGSIQIAQASDPILDTLAVNVVRGMVFHPGGMGSAPVRVSVSLPINFGLDAPRVAPEYVGVFSEACVDKKPVMKSRVTGYSRPASMAAQGQHITLHVDAVIDTAGVARVIDVERPLNTNTDLVEHAREDVAGAKFEPGRLMGRKVPVRMSVPIQAIMIVQVVPN